MSLLAAYYASQEQDNAAHAQYLGAQARLATLQGNELGANSAAARDEQASRAQANRAGAQKTGQESQQVGPNAQAARTLQGAQTAETGARTQAIPYDSAGLFNQRTADVNRTNALNGPPLGSGGGGGGTPAPSGDVAGLGGGMPLSNADPTASLGGGGGADPNQDPTQGFEKGGKVKTEHQAVLGKSQKPGPTDTVPVMLTPGEAVLNKGAVGHYGTDVIHHMNQMGLLRMGAQSEVAGHLGLPDPHAPPQQAGKQPPDRKGTKTTPKSSTPAGARPGFAKGGIVLPTFTTGADKAAVAGQAATLDPTSYALGILHGAAVGPAAQPTKGTRA